MVELTDILPQIVGLTQNEELNKMILTNDVHKQQNEGHWGVQRRRPEVKATRSDPSCRVSSPNMGGASGNYIHLHLHPPPAKTVWGGGPEGDGSQPEAVREGFRGKLSRRQTILPCSRTGRCDLEVLLSTSDSMW